ncbi:MAG: hypothetical protein F6J90_09065 [Moorea sp. SIOASIH]|uniref:hypothetical protein n=1 Tax=Moorena sp. SIOASIH TaxID=2607817 RepID=UPI0013BE2EDE|nr:hypothetical protein [Moorena sp. SIOASIH]NEO36462.1 hypothetical protein [Moorena sp. SIOASIH]NEO92791.1 hypothetical protein [Moorena sp. SIO3G5]
MSQSTVAPSVVTSFPPKRETVRILIVCPNFPPQIPHCFHTELQPFPQFSHSFPQASTVALGIPVLLGIFPT